MNSKEPEKSAPVFKTSMENPDAGLVFQAKPFKHNVWSREAPKLIAEKEFRVYFLSKISAALLLLLLLFGFRNNVLCVVIALVSFFLAMFMIFLTIQDRREIDKISIALNIAVPIMPVILSLSLIYLNVMVTRATSY